MTTPLKNPLIGTPLHLALTQLQQAEKHIAYEFGRSPENAKRLGETNACVADAIDQLRRELNRQYAELKGRGAATPPSDRPRPTDTPPAAPVIVLEMPGRNARPVSFPKTKRGLRELLDFTAAALNDGGAAILVMNAKVFDRLAELGFGEEVEGLREAAREQLTPAAE